MLLFQILLATLAISSLSFAGLLVLVLNKYSLQKLAQSLVALAAGTLLGAAFWHLLPEALESIEPIPAFSVVLFTFIVFFLIEKVLHWQHCHDAECEVHSFGYINLIGDGLHNFIDGLLIAAAFSAGAELGWISVLAIALHEIPQEWGDFGVLLHAGFKPRRALLANFASALLAVVGGLIGWFLSSHVETAVPWLLPVAAGAFIYIAAADLVPELRKETSLKKSLIYMLLFMVGLAVMWLSLALE
jgi:zinc and cadmium transporter